MNLKFQINPSSPKSLHMKYDTLFFAAGDFVHPAIDEMQSPHLGESILCDGDVVFRFETEASSVGMPALQNELPHTRRKQQATLLLNQSDALGANLRRKSMRGESVQENMTGERFESAGNELEKSGFAAGIRAKNRHDFSRLGLKAEGFQRKERGLRRIGSVDVAGLFDAEAHIGIAARLIRRGIRGEGMGVRRGVLMRASCEASR